ncbi:M2 family metallopeptidase [Arenimonas fontis]|uniref:M2 family metallopeptidase n=1 Tax=Arenimonas fontis TaxID=2608255 RepID=A0A5B2ZEA3_9GAMM|nr:M2 family metallopeptidase [Arenimonas fontis]KAA2286235.1 M2 family metallopeptidase [Arenimonas fontis]
MKYHRALLALAVSAGLSGLAACTPADDKSADARPAESADEFIARVNKTQKEMTPEITSAFWLSSTYINADSQRVAAAANERALATTNGFIEQAKLYDVSAQKPETARALTLIKVGASMPAPRDPAKLKELTTIASGMEAAYGAGKWCVDGDCKDIGQITDILADIEGHSYDQLKAAWEGWHTISIPMRKDYQRFVELTNEGAREMGYANTGEVWRAGYDMPAEDFQAEADRLWGQVEPLYEQLHCYVRGKLEDRYGERGQVDGMIPAHLTGNLWQQDWSNLWPLVQPYPDAGSLDISAALKKQRDALLAEMVAEAGGMSKLTAAEQVELERKADREMAVRMTKLAESFYTGLGMPALPESFYTDSMLIQPRDRDVVCHASAWPMNTEGEVRIKMCIKPTEEELTTIYHELGHIYYYLAYKSQPPVFQNGAHDGFHEAIGDTIVLSMTPEYLASIGLVDKPLLSQEAVINAQMRMALSKVAFMPFGLLIDRWRWGVFDGSISPENYNRAWWELKAKYQGVAPVEPRGEEFFDPGAKYHVPGNTPYTRYFLSHVLQFQFYKALCDAAGHEGPLYTCNFANSSEAGKRYWAMMERGASQPWQQTLRELTGGEQMDASAVLEYFQPLQTWLQEQNQGKDCGWMPAGS